MTMTADALLAGISEEDLQHVREKAQRLHAEILELQSKLRGIKGPAQPTHGQIAYLIATKGRRDALKAQINDRINEYRPLAEALRQFDKQRNIERANQDQRERFKDLRAAAVRAVTELQRRRDDSPSGWLAFGDEPLARSLNDLLEAVRFYSGEDVEDDERFAAPRQPGPAGVGES